MFRALAVAIALFLAALDLLRPYAGPALRPAQWAAGLAAVLLLAVWPRPSAVRLRERAPTLALALLLVPVYVDHTRRIDIGDPVHYYSLLRSVLFDGDLDLVNDFVIFGWPGREFGAVLPVGAAVLWSPFVVPVHLGRLAGQALGLPPPLGTEPVYASAVALATFVYGAAALFLLQHALRRFVGSPWAAFWATVLCWVGSPLRFYLSVIPTVAHGVEFFAAVLVLWTYLRLRETAGPAVVRASSAAGLACGLAFLCRSQDGLLLALPGVELLLRLREVSERPRTVRAMGALGAAFAAAALPQVVVWQVMFGRPVLVPHTTIHAGGFMDLRHPHLVDALVDARGGLFASHPVLVLGLLGLLLLARRDLRYVLAVAPILLAGWYVNASVFDWYHVRRYTGLVPLLAPGLAVLVAPLASVFPAMALLALFVWRYDLAVDALRPLPGHPVPVRAALRRVADDSVQGAYRLVAWPAPGLAVRLVEGYGGGTPEGVLARVDFGTEDARLRLPEPARHLSAPAVEDGERARWVTDQDARLWLALDASGGAVLRLRARPLETPEPQVMRVSWNGVALGQATMRPAWTDYTFEVPGTAMRRGTNLVELWFERAPIFHRVRGHGPRQVRPAALAWLELRKR